MDTQHQIKRTLSQPQAIAWVRQRLEQEPQTHRTALAEATCQHFGFYDPGGQPQHGSCLKALRRLESAGHFTLPPPRVHPGRSQPRRLAAPLPPPQGVPPEVGQVAGLQLLLVRTPEQLRVWNEMMLVEHPRGAGPLVGRQLRYLVASDHGWLGGLGFGAAALHLADRDRWMGWDTARRGDYLDRVVGLSRFLIRPGVHCHNLASHVLGLVRPALLEDFQRQYHYAPWLLETFVDPACFSGTCFQAANWIRVGRTQGRGRQDRERRYEETPKDIYVYPLDKDFRRRLGLPPQAGGGPLGPAEGLEGDGWAAYEFGGAPLGDARLSQRLVDSAAVQAHEPHRAFTGVAAPDWAAVKGYYRLIDHPDTQAVNLENILAPHRQRTLRRMQAQRVVLCVQDGTDLDYHHLDQCEGLGVIGTNQTGAQTRGLHLHTTLAVAPNGLPLGVLQAQCEAPAPPAAQDGPEAAARPPEEKETFCWIEGLRDLGAVAAQLPQTRLISVCDRGADIFALFDEQRSHPRVDLLVRAKHDRRTKGPLKLFDTVRQTPVEGHVSVPLGRRSRRPKRSKQKARLARPARTAELALRYTPVTLPPPDSHAGAEPLTLWVIQAVEEAPPVGEEAVEWFLLTTIALDDAEQAAQCLRWYCLRWRVEDWHRVLKSGCRVEALGHESAARLERAIALKLVIAWRIMVLTLLGREAPELPAEVLFSDLEIRVLQAYAKKRQLPAPEHLGAAVRLVAQLGGYLARRRDPPPGHQLMWYGYIKLEALCEGFTLARDG